VLFVLLAYTLLQAHLFLRHRQQTNPRTRERLLQLVNPSVELVVAYYQQRFCLLSLAEFAVLLLELEEAARAKLLPRMKQLQRDIYHLLQNARPPESALVEIALTVRSPKARACRFSPKHPPRRPHFPRCASKGQRSAIAARLALPSCFPNASQQSPPLSELQIPSASGTSKSDSMV